MLRLGMLIMILGSQNVRVKLKPGMGSSRTVLDLKDGSRTKNRGLGLGLEEVWPWPWP